MTGQLKLGVVQVVSPSTGEILGYAFTTESGRGQLQRWLLYKNPNNSFEIRPPPEHMQNWTLADWRANMATLWKPNSFYIWAQSDVYPYGTTCDGVTWTQIPSTLPNPTYPEVNAEGFEVDPTPWRVLVRQNDLCGWVYAIGSIEEASSAEYAPNREYWMLPPGYQPAGGSCNAVIALDIEKVQSFDDFVSLANHNWSAGCSFVITGCINYRGPVAPAAA